MNKFVYATIVCCILSLSIAASRVANVEAAFPTSVDSQITDSVTQVSLSSTDWPMFHHDLTHSGYTSSAGPTNNQILWQ
jgi:hypothetical protein